MHTQEQRGRHRRREPWAFVAVPFVATFVWYLVTLLHLAFFNGRIRWGPDVFAMAIGAVIVGLPISGVTTVLLALPLWWAVRRSVGVSFVTTTLAGVGIGLLLAGIAAVVTREWSLLFSPAHGVGAGLAASTSWWYLAGKPAHPPNRSA